MPPDGPLPRTAPAVELRGIDKRFGTVHANRSVDLVVERGHIHGLIGENGAGKSTLMSILYGFYTADSGDILIGGQKTAIVESRDAIAAGIEMVHQHFMLVDPMTVLENVILGVEGGALLRKHVPAAREELRRISGEYGLNVEPDAVVGELPVGAQQRVEILKALYRGAEILILDEPTGVLTPQEATDLFRVLDALRGQGKTVILVTHKLREIMAITDRVSVMRAGQMVGHRLTSETSTEELGELMIGRKLATRLDKAPVNTGDVMLDVRDLSVRDAMGVQRVKGVGFNVRAGEIVGIAGVSGNGQTELMEALAGMRRFEAGSVTVGGTTVSAAHPAYADTLRKLGMAHVPEDRLRTGLVPAFAARESAILGYQDDPAYSRGPLLDWPGIERHTLGLMEKYEVKPPIPRLRGSLFSGGNQQKLIMAREMERDPAVLLVGQPTRGVDIGGIDFIHRRLLAMRDRGKAILLVSVELDEILRLSDRILVMFDGRLVGELLPENADERQLGLLMAGVEQ
jgi:general nucleoside transport system ATP-binding protein